MISNDEIWNESMWYDVMKCELILCNVMSLEMKQCDMIWYDVMLYDVMWHDMLCFDSLTCDGGSIDEFALVEPVWRELSNLRVHAVPSKQASKQASKRETFIEKIELSQCKLRLNKVKLGAKLGKESWDRIKLRLG